MYERLHAAVGGEAAVNGNVHTGDKTGGLVIQQEQQAAFQLFRSAKTAHGRSGQDLLRPGSGGSILIPQQLVVLLAGEEAGSDGIDPDVGSGEMDCQPLGKVGHRGLGAGIGRDHGQRGIGKY